MKKIRCLANRPRNISKVVIVVALVLAISIVLGAMTAQALVKQVQLTIDGKTFFYNTIRTNVGEFLKDNDIVLTKDDYINVPLDTNLKENMHIIIKRAFEVKILVDGKEMQVYIPNGTVEDVIKKAGISLGKNDKVNLPLSEVLNKPTVIKITRVVEKVVAQNVPISFSTITKTNYNMDYGKQKVVQNGHDGVVQNKFKVILEDGKEISKELISQKVIKAPKPRIIEVGAIRWFKTSRGEVVRYKKVYSMIATAYQLSPGDTGKKPSHPDYGKTATGYRVRRGIVAVDPRVIPLGTRLYVEGYGFAQALDTGSAIKGNRIDVFVEKNADSFGVRRVKVYVLAD